MRFWFAAMVAAVWLSSPAAAPAAAPVDCGYDRAAVMAMAPRAFNSTPGRGWRVLGEKDGCWVQGADLLAEYREAHPDAPADDLTNMRWHEGQLRAALGQTDRAIALMESTIRPFDPQNLAAADLDNNIYVEATLAFLRNDRVALLDARARYAAMPVPDWFAKAAADVKARHGQDLAWPMNLKIIDGLVACFGRPYSEAYGGCRLD